MESKILMKALAKALVNGLLENDSDEAYHSSKEECKRQMLRKFMELHSADNFTDAVLTYDKAPPHEDVVLDTVELSRDLKEISKQVEGGEIEKFACCRDIARMAQIAAEERNKTLQAIDNGVHHDPERFAKPFDPGYEPFEKPRSS